MNLAILYIMLSLGLNIVVGFAGLLDLGYIAFYAVGAYTYALLASPHFNIHLPFWVILPIGALVAAMFGVLLGGAVVCGAAAVVLARARTTGRERAGDSAALAAQRKLSALRHPRPRHAHAARHRTPRVAQHHAQADE
jgi:hypothetical protein